MLILNRKLGERIVLPNCEMVVTVVAVEGQSVRLGISAPREVDVCRQELWRQSGRQEPCRADEIQELPARITMANQEERYSLRSQGFPPSQRRPSDRRFGIEEFPLNL